ncbi:MAG: hypothetical protein WBE86_16920 [Candidatus Acidiferrales bacterium]
MAAVVTCPVAPRGADARLVDARARAAVAIPRCSNEGPRAVLRVLTEGEVVSHDV